MAPCRLLLVAALLVLAGCEDPYQPRGRDEASRSGTPPAADRARGDERPPPPEDRDAASTIGTDAQTTARAAAGAFCTQWANWDWRTIERQQQRLAWLATGALARQLTAEAQRRAQDRVLRRDKLGTRGRVIALDIQPGARTRDAVCVTLEEQIANGHGDPDGARHRVYLATIAQTSTGWAVRRWEPQP